MFPSLTVFPEALAHLRALAADEEDYQADVLQARQYDAGVQFVHLTERLREFLGGDVDNTIEDYDRLRLNICRTVVAAVVERLIVSGFDTDEEGVSVAVVGEDGTESTTTEKPLASWAWRTWQRNRMDAKQRRVHEACVRDSESFVIVDWDSVNGMARFTPHLRYVDQSLTTHTGADVGEGCKAFYRNDDADQDLLYVTKRWTEVYYEAGQRKQRQRLTMYYPDRVEKYAGTASNWRPIQDEGDLGWPIVWQDSVGAPLGIPVAHFRVSSGMEAREAWPAQNAINYLCVLELTAGDATAFRILIALGWEPRDADGNPLPIAPGTWVGTMKADGKVEVVDPADISGISNLVEAWVFRAAMATDTPVSRFITTKAIASEGTQKQQDGPLVNKVRGRQGEIGNSWEDCLMIARRLENTFGVGGLDERPMFSTTWEPAEVRDEDAELARAAKKQSLQIPIEEIWADLGYPADKIALWKAQADARREEEMALATKQPSANGNGVPFGRVQ
jgi:hypothetical protein